MTDIGAIQQATYNFLLSSTVNMSLSCTISETLSPIYQNLNSSYVMLKTRHLLGNL